jgi:hypothetical protein
MTRSGSNPPPSHRGVAHGLRPLGYEPTRSECGWPQGCRSPERSPTRSIPAARRTAGARHRTAPGPGGSAIHRAHPPPGRLCRRRAMDEDVAVTGGGLCLHPRAVDPVCHIRHQGVLLDRTSRRPVTGHKDRDAVEVIAAPMFGLIRGVATREDRAGSSDFVEELLADAGRIDRHRRRTGLRNEPNHRCSRMKLSPPGLPGVSLGLRCTRQRTSTCRGRISTLSDPRA